MFWCVSQVMPDTKPGCAFYATNPPVGTLADQLRTGATSLSGLLDVLSQMPIPSRASRTKQQSKAAGGTPQGGMPQQSSHHGHDHNAHGSDEDGHDHEPHDDQPRDNGNVRDSDDDNEDDSEEEEQNAEEEEVPAETL